MSDRPNDKDFLEALIRWSGLTATGVAKKANLTPSTITRPLNFPVKHRLSMPTMEKLQFAFPDFPGFADNYRILSEVAPTGSTDPIGDKFGEKPLPMIPLLGTAMAGEWEGPKGHIEMTEVDMAEVLDHLRRPQSLASDRQAYAVTIVGESMFPRFRPGRRVIVSPRSTPAIGDDVVVQLLGDADDFGDRRVSRVLIKELVRRTPTHVELRQYTPLTDFTVKASKIAAIHKVVGEVY